MTPEWMHAMETVRRRRTKADAMADPLEAPEWAGLETVSRLFCRLISADRREAPESRRRAPPFRMSAAYRR